MKIDLLDTNYLDTKILYVSDTRVATVFLSPPYKHRPYPHWRYVWNFDSKNLGTEERAAATQVVDDFIISLNITARLTS